MKLLQPAGNDLIIRFPLIVETLARLRSRSCILDGEAVACDDNGVASFDRIRYGRHDASVFLYAFDLIELSGDDLRRDPLQVRKATLASRHPVQRAHRRRHRVPTPLANSEGIVSKRKDSAIGREECVLVG